MSYIFHGVEKDPAILVSKGLSSKRINGTVKVVPLHLFMNIDKMRKLIFSLSGVNFTNVITLTGTTKTLHK